MIEIFKTFTFDSAHWLPEVPEGHKCKNMHGHTYTLTLFLKGELKQKEGWLLDFAVIKEKIDPILKLVDHKVLNEVKGLENPTCELFCIWWFEKLKPIIPELNKIELKETPTSGAVYCPN